MKKQYLRGVFWGLAWLAMACVAGAQQTPVPTSSSDASTDGPIVAAPTTKATLYIYRHRRYEGAALKPSVYVDDKEMARAENGRFFVAHLNPGKHSIRSNDKASGMDIDMQAGGEYYVRVDMQTGFWKGHGRLTMIMSEQGSYEMKQTKPLSDGDIKDHELVGPGAQQ